ncbi:MAG: discoidin domain-containing protein [Candidatus Omnitrophota bacterium]|nr:discoidin domain-containing protein [Candidatus Omnitrophota bacterium]
MFSIVLSGLVMAYLDMVGFLSKAATHKMNRYRVANVAEAGINRIAWYLENTAPDSTTNGTWRGTVTENITITETGLSRTYSYNAVSSDLPLEGPVITASSSAGVNVASRAMDGSLNNYWRSSGGVPQWLQFSLAINGDYTIYLGRVRMLLGAATATQFPRTYMWQTSTNGTTWTTRINRTATYPFTCNSANTCIITDTFTLTQANYIRLWVTATQGAGVVNVGEVEIDGVVVPATATSSNAIDNSLTTSWSASPLPQSFTLTFPSGSNYSVNKIRMRNPNTQTDQFPATYTLDVYASGSWTNSVVYTESQLGLIPDATATFNTLQTNVTALRINVSAVQGGGNTVIISEIDLPAVCISSVCSVTYPGTGDLGGTKRLSYYAAQNVIVDGTSPPSVNRQPKAIFGVESGQ